MLNIIAILAEAAELVQNTCQIHEISLATKIPVKVTYDHYL
jgi:hypothetical protein